LAERRSGAGHPSRERVQRPDSDRDAGRGHGAGRRHINGREPCCVPLDGFSPLADSFFERGRLGEGGSKGGEPRRGKQHEPAPPAAFPTEMREHSLWALRVGGATRVTGA